jgi:hypothetical protein
VYYYFFGGIQIASFVSSRLFDQKEQPLKLRRALHSQRYGGNELSRVAVQLCELSLDKGSFDNMSVVLVQMVDPSEKQAAEATVAAAVAAAVAPDEDFAELDVAPATDLEKSDKYFNLSYTQNLTHWYRQTRLVNQF